MIFSKTMPKSHGDILTRIRTVKDACGQVRGSGALKKVMSSVLRIGNYLNHGVDAPDAGGDVEVRGFTVESLLKLRDFRAAQGGEVSALHCVVLHLIPLEPKLPTQMREELLSVLEPNETAGGVVSGGISDLKDA